MPTTDCLAGLIGLSAGANACFPLPTVVSPSNNDAITVSRSGLYLDTVEGLMLRPAQGQSAASDLYTRLANARTLAESTVRTALAQRSRTRSGAQLYAQRGVLGGIGNGVLQPLGTPARMQFYTKAARFGAFRLVSLQLYTDIAVTSVPVLLDGVQVGTLTAGGPGGLFVPLVADEPVRIPFDGNLHTLEAILPENVRVHTNKMWCSSCQKNTPWGLALARNLVEAQCASSSGGGFAVQLQEECTETLDKLCYAIAVDTPEGVELGELGHSVAFAILYKAAELFTDSLLVDAQVSRYTMLEPKALGALAAKYQAQSEAHVAWLSDIDGLGRINHPCYAGPAPRLSTTNTL